jgi:hypothetical protein
MHPDRLRRLSLDFHCGRRRASHTPVGSERKLSIDEQVEFDVDDLPQDACESAEGGPEVESPTGGHGIPKIGSFDVVVLLILHLLLLL